LTVFVAWTDLAASTGKWAWAALLLRPLDFFILPLSIFAGRDETGFAGDLAASVRGARTWTPRRIRRSNSRFLDFAGVGDFADFAAVGDFTGVGFGFSLPFLRIDSGPNG